MFEIVQLFQICSVANRCCSVVHVCVLKLYRKYVVFVDLSLRTIKYVNSDFSLFVQKEDALMHDLVLFQLYWLGFFTPV